jgi:hypothetical protein
MFYSDCEVVMVMVINFVTVSMLNKINSKLKFNFIGLHTSYSCYIFFEPDVIF